MHNYPTAIFTNEPEKIAAAEKIATHCQIPLITDLNQLTDQTYLLILTKDYLGLQKTSASKWAPFYIDFLSGKFQHRRLQASLRKELLARAIGTHPREKPMIVDATAGLGRDSFILATLGFEVTMLERSQILFLLLEDALHRAKDDAIVGPIVNRMRLIHTDTKHWLAQVDQKINIIYLDPMFPQRQKSASVKKEMVILQELLGKDEDAEDVFNLAVRCANKRVVVKRPRLAANIGLRKPNFSLSGKSSRFDVYLTNDILKTT